MNRYEQILNNTDPALVPIDVQQLSPSLDPRPDLAQDHHHWVRILTNARAVFDEDKYHIGGGRTSLYKILHGLRCAGCRLEETLHAFKLHPGSEEYADPAKWDADKHRWLDPVKDDLLRLFHLSKMGQVAENEELPAGVFAAKEDAAVPSMVPPTPKQSCFWEEIE